MSAVALLAVMAPSAGATASAKGVRNDARATNETADFVAALEEAIAAAGTAEVPQFRSTRPTIGAPEEAIGAPEEAKVSDEDDESLSPPSFGLDASEMPPAAIPKFAGATITAEALAAQVPTPQTTAAGPDAVDSGATIAAATTPSGLLGEGAGQTLIPATPMTPQGTLTTKADRSPGPSMGLTQSASAAPSPTLAGPEPSPTGSPNITGTAEMAALNPDLQSASMAVRTEADAKTLVSPGARGPIGEEMAIVAGSRSSLRNGPADAVSGASQGRSSEAASRSEVPNASPPEVSAPKIVLPVASDRAREVAAARSAVVTAIRPAKTPAEAVVPTPEAVAGTADDEAQGEVSETVSVDTTPPSVDAAQAPAGRVRDVIDRAASRVAAQAGSLAEPAASKSETKGAETPAQVAQAVPGSDKLGSTPPSANLSPLPVGVEEPAGQPMPAGVAQATETRGPEPAQTPVLSTLSRTTLETTVQIAAQIVRKLEGRSTRFEMALTPDDLGRVDVSLDIDADGALHATLAFDNPVAATELRGRVDELRRQLIEAGFTVADDALSFAERDPSAGQGGGFDRDTDPRSARVFGAAARANAEVDLTLQTPRWISLSLTPAGVDMKV